ncbi:MAG TPA: hypothetical protein DCX06_09170 [Opitutae bacterium]|nr:hypothetical protein [Opitutae bacterium]
MRTVNDLLAAISLLPCFLFAAAPELEVWLEPTTTQPGDIVELHAQVEGPEFASFELQIPKHDALYLVSKQDLPVDYQNGTYRQKSIWVLQTIQTGAFELSEIQATVQHQKQSTTQTIAPIAFKVDAYRTVEDSDTPLPLPERTRSESSVEVNKILIVSVLLITLGLLAIVIRKNESSTQASPEHKPAPTLDDLKALLDSGKLPRELIQVLLEQNNLPISDAQRKALEQVAYRPNHPTSAKDLRNTLDEETKP